VTPLFELVLLEGRHDRTVFDCGAEPLNRYFSQQVSQDIRRRVTACYVALSQDGRIARVLHPGLHRPAAVPAARRPGQKASPLPDGAGRAHGPLGR